MKALICKNKSFNFEDIDQAVPSKDEILIKVINTSLNAGDYRLIQLNSGLPKTGILGMRSQVSWIALEQK